MNEVNEIVSRLDELKETIAKSTEVRFPDLVNVYVENQPEQKSVVSVANLDEIKLPPPVSEVTVKNPEVIAAALAEHTDKTVTALSQVVAELRLLNVSLKNIREDLKRK